ncbi:MAG: ABC transporter substrate-binding protein [Chlorobi bacterium]|nr:ABC transporter substrate-binding protein [Chlorobiota bacterium]
MIKHTILVFLITLFSCVNSNSNYKRDVNDLRIISLVPSLTKELESLGLTENIVGATSYCDITKNNKDLIVGSAVKVNMEKVLLLKPDVVFAGGLTNGSYIKTMRNEGIKVYKFPNPGSYNGICNDFIRIGKITGREKKAEEIVNKTRKRIKRICSSIPETDAKPKMFFQIGANPIYAVIPNTFMNDYITLAGCKNIAADLKSGSVSRETILSRNPDVIFISTMGMVGENEKKIWKSYKELSAAANNRIFIIDSDIACSATVESFADALQQIVSQVWSAQETNN